jgi:hypothetical protein
MTDPTPEQLHHLAARARDGVALDAEHDALANGITAMAARLAKAERSMRRAQGSESWMAKGLARQDSRVHGLTKELAKQRQRADRAEAANERVRQLHQPAPDWSWAVFGCTHHGQHKTECPACGGCYPCATVEALDQAQQPTTAEADRV